MATDAIAERFAARLDMSGGKDACWPWIRRDGTPGKSYFTVMLPGTGRLQRVTRLLVDASDDVEVCHRCDNPPCCNPRHLFLATHQENMQDAGRKGRLLNQGVANPNTRLTEDDVRMIRSEAALGVRHWELAERYGLTRGAVSHMVRGLTWSHV
jgi:hypothetical protein